ncbi:MAG: alpha-L-fucosidase [Candidatus Abyssobacteria bacterium SURF_5]|uniref:alpha-L-fucosidase n=1 Tax=Abyssobacteria bacterium (strain SURF_5) TaxID=2093360 RepID=A0A3A4N858_ABYX5|nr:MAG: alpha-L-fucosidase [Candidatus Abyssubacteria bacterium SURF_5]
MEELRRQSLQNRPLSKWFDDAKLGIFIHWGVFSIPAWAPFGDDYQTLIKRKGYRYQLAHNPYAEWYLNTMKITGSPTCRHHIEKYGEDFSYYDFVPQFEREAAKINPGAWAELFAKAGARYVVMVTKHHDGYTLWPTAYENPRRTGLHSERDFVKEVTEAVRTAGLKMGLYYSGGLDWTFKKTAISDPYTFLTNTPQEDEYVTYATNHFRELIDWYKPSVLWNDIRWPQDPNLTDLFSYYYSVVPDGVINDRWSQTTYPENRIMRSIINTVAWFRAKHASGEHNPPPIHCDYITPEYRVLDQISAKKWEACRGLGTSFGYNMNEPDDNLLTAEELIHSFADIVSKNGNLLINVGPMADGTIPDAQRDRLMGLGAWLAVNGDAIYNTRPWVTAEDKTRDGKGVRFTQKDEALYAIILGPITDPEITIESLRCAPNTKIHLLGEKKPLHWRQDGSGLTILLPEALPDAPAYSFKMAPRPER